MDTRERRRARSVKRRMRRVEAAGMETIGDIQSSGCLGQKEVVTAAHNACIRELLQEVNVHGNADRHMKLLTRQNELSRQEAVGHTVGPRTVYAILLEGRVVGSSERGRDENPVEGRE
jgi:hypothetical protein